MGTRVRTIAVRPWAVVLVVASLLFLSLGLAARADDSVQPYLLTNADQISGTLPGSDAGSFANFEVNYPGSDAALIVKVSFVPYDPSYQSSMGLNVYGPNGFSGVGTWNDDDKALEFYFNQDAAATLAVQLYNYSDRTVSYTVVATGLPETAAVAEEETVAVTEEEAAAVTEEDAAAVTEEETATVTEEETAAPSLKAGVTGTLTGNAGCASALYPLTVTRTYNSDGSVADVTVTMVSWPEDPTYAGTYGFNIYSANGDLVATATTTDTLGERSATFSSNTEGEYVVQVYNYADGVSFSYILSATQ